MTTTTQTSAGVTDERGESTLKRIFSNSMFVRHERMNVDVCLPVVDVASKVGWGPGAGAE